MALQLGDFLNMPIATPKPYFENLLPGILEGYKMSRVPKEIAQKERDRELANQLSEIKAQYLPQESEAEIKSKQAQALMNEQKAKQFEMSQNFLRNLLQGGQAGQQFGQFGQDGQAGGAFEAERNKRAALAAGLGGVLDNKKLVEILTEKNPALTPQQDVISRAQKENLAIDNVIPLIEDLKKQKVPGQLIGKWLSPNKQARYESGVTANTESLVTAFGYPGTDKGIQEAAKLVSRRAGESLKNYRERLDDEIEKLRQRRQKNLKISGIGAGSEESANQIIARDTINGINYVQRRDGAWYEE